MANTLARRTLVGGLPILAALGATTRTRAQAKPTLTAVDWGGQTLSSVQAIQRFQNVADVRWELHAGGAAAILAKIAASWPHVNYDVVAAWSPVFVSMAREGWLEKMTAEEMPNIVNIPSPLFVRDRDGDIVTIPRELNNHMWGYRPDLCPFPITRIQDLLDKRLKAKIVFPGPVLNTGTQMIVIARAFGGSEAAMEPAWEFVKQLARNGNIGRVSNSDTETHNSLTSGETCIGFGAASHFVRIAEAGLPVQPLAKMPAESGFCTVIAMQGWCVLKGGQVATAKAWINALVAPEPNGIETAISGTVPANSLAPVSDAMKPVRYAPDELPKYTYTPDWSIVSAELPNWVRRWEREVTPLL